MQQQGPFAVHIKAREPTLYSRELAAILKEAPFLRSRGSFALTQTPSTFVPCPAKGEATSC